MHYLGNHLSKSFYWKPITLPEVGDQLLSLDPKKACGFNNIPVKLLKDGAHNLSKPLYHYYTLLIFLWILVNVLSL